MMINFTMTYHCSNNQGIIYANACQFESPDAGNSATE